MEAQQIIRETRSWGNSAGILLPREWIGNQVKVILINRTPEIKKEVLNLLEPYLEEIIGIYITGSYARHEETSKSDIDILVISKNLKKTIKSGKYDISIITLEGAKKTMEKNPVLILPRLAEAKTILNSTLIEELKSQKLDKTSFKELIEETKRTIKINKGFINLDKTQQKEHLTSLNVIYSLILRLRGLFLADCLLKKRKYFKKEFLNMLENALDKSEAETAYRIYESIRDNKRVKEKITLESTEKLLNLLIENIKEW